MASRASSVGASLRGRPSRAATGARGDAPLHVSHVLFRAEISFSFVLVRGSSFSLSKQTTDTRAHELIAKHRNLFSRKSRSGRMNMFFRIIQRLRSAVRFTDWLTCMLSPSYELQGAFSCPP